MARGWSRSASWWLEMESLVGSSVMRWPGMVASYITPARSFNWSLRRWAGLMDVSIVDELVWRVVTAFESVALVSMLCFFFLFCGCTI
ncbi:hypothetical protein L6164_034944 [Bauhinia variegata]|uniref:Uncharacterized protein n=1 Tax=Bauhinia variegata TaxID=167791 RepID=A0ACB9KXT3_BAUVA|nr:hypothetical protein L6164_034944 [Bauhinia variegata]